MKKTKIIILIWFVSIFACTTSVRASYQNDATILDYINGDLDDFYTEIYNQDNVTIHFAWNNDSNLLYLNYSEAIVELQIDTNIITEDSESKYHKCVFAAANKEIEIWFDRGHYVSSDDEYIIRINDGSPFRITVSPTIPQPPPPPPPPPPELPSFSEWFRTFGWIFAVIFSILTLIIMRFFFLSKNPYLYPRVENQYNCECLGRYISSEYDEKLRKYKYYFKKASKKKGQSVEGVRIVYSDLSFNDIESYALNIKNFLINTISGFHQLMPHIILKKIAVPDNVVIKNRQEVAGKKFYKILYKFISFLPMKSVVYSLFDKIYEETDENVEEIEYMELEYSREALEFRFNVTYKQKELNDEGKEEWVEINEENVAYGRILSLKKSEIRKLKYNFSDAQLKVFRSIKEALQNRDSNDQLKSKYIVKELELSSENKQLADENYQLYQQLRDLKDSFNSALIHELNKFIQKSEHLNQKLPEIVGEVFYNRRLGMKDEEVFEKALTKINTSEETTGNEKTDKLIQLNVALADKIKELEEKIENVSLIGGDI